MKPASIEKPLLSRTLSSATVWSIALGAVIGFGCFVLPGIWLQQAGPAGTVIGLALGGLMMIPIGKGFGYMIKAFPVAGGPFAFAYHGFGRNHAYVCGWLLSLGYLAIVALNATALPILVQFNAPVLFKGSRLYGVGGCDVMGIDVMLSSTAIVLFGYLNYRGSQWVGRAQLLMVTLLVTSVGLLGIGAFCVSEVSLDNLYPLFPANTRPSVCTLSILAIAPWAFVGFDTIPHAAEEFNFKPEIANRLIVLAVVFGILSYVIVTLSTAVVFPWSEAVGKNPVWATGAAMRAKMGRSGPAILSLGVLMAIFTGINGFFLATSRLLYAMARARILPPWFGKISPRHRTPVNALLFDTVAALFAPWFGRNVILWIVEMSSVGITVGYAYTCLVAFKISKEHKQGRKLYLLGAIFSVGFLLLLCIPGMPAFMNAQSWSALGIWIALGGCFYSVRGKVYRCMSADQLERLILNVEEER